MTRNDTTFNELVAELDYPMFIVTVAAGDERAGCLVGFATQASIDTPRFLVCLSKRNRTIRLASAADSLVVHFVPEDAPDLAELFGGETSDDVDKFAGCEWHPGPGGAPVLERCPNWFAGRVLECLDAGDHVAFLLEPFEAHKGESKKPLPFHSARRIEPGHDA
jgi:flavin reductase (DIM6/NTAB) family NADH-FMN oxidoreductase RutF